MFSSKHTDTTTHRWANTLEYYYPKKHAYILDTSKKKLNFDCTMTKKQREVKGG